MLCSLDLMTYCCCCCPWKTYHASVGPFEGPEIFSTCRLEYIDNKRFLNVLHVKPNITPSELQRQEPAVAAKEETKVKDEKSSKTSLTKDGPLVNSVANEESDSDVDTTNKTVIVKVDLERPNTSETLNSRLSLPPLSIGSPSITYESLTKKHLRKLRSLLPKRQSNNKIDEGELTTTNIDVQPKKPKRLSVFSLRMRKSQKPAVAENLDVIQACPEQEAPDLVSSSTNVTTDEPGRTKSTVSFTSYNAIPVDSSQFAMFFIHGVGGSLKIWQNQLSYFYNKGFELIAIDLIGHGSSSLPGKKKDYTFDAIKNDIIIVFDKYSKQHNIVVAHSYGTCFGAVLCRERPNKVSHLVFLSSGAPVPLDPEDGPFKLPTPVLALFRPVLNETFLKLAFSKPPSPETFRRAFGVRTGVLKKTMQGQHWPNGNITYHQQINVPTLLIFGNLDGLVSFDEMNEMRKAIPDSHLEIIEQASHMVMQEAGDLVNGLIEKFLNLCPLSELPAPLNDEETIHGFSHRRTKSPGAVSRSLPPTKAFRLKTARKR